MPSTSAADSAIDSFHTAQEGSSICVIQEAGAVWMHHCLMDEVSSRLSAQQPSKRQEHDPNRSLSLQPPSILATPSRVTASFPSARPSRSPMRMPVKHTHLRTPPPESTPACKRLCTRAVASEPGTPDISPRQLGFSADNLKPAAASTAAAQPDQELPVSPEPSGTQPQWSGSFDSKVRNVLMEHTDIQHAYSNSAARSLPSEKHSKGRPGELDMGKTSPTVKAQAGGRQLRLAASAGPVKMPEQNAVSRRRLSFFAQLRRPAQVSWQDNTTTAADGESAVPLPRQKTAQEQRDSQHRFKRAYVDVQLAKQWAAGQTWAELDACGVPWSPESSATAEDRWQELDGVMRNTAASNAVRRDAEKEWEDLRRIRMRLCGSQKTLSGLPAIKSILKPTAARAAGCASLRLRMCKVRIQERS